MEAALTIPFWLELMATIAGALSGSIHAVKHNYDFFGVVCLACITGLSGGIVRDILLQNYGIYAFQHWELIAACMVGAVPVFFFARLLGKLDLPMDIMDTISIALYAVIGAVKGLIAGYGILPAAILGTITAVGGGCARDLVLLRPPRIFISGTLYASATFLGALIYLAAKQVDVLAGYAAPIGVVSIIVMRFVSVFFKIETRPARDYSDKVEHLASCAKNHCAGAFRKVRRK